MQKNPQKPMEDQEVLNFYGKRDCVGILGCPDLRGGNIFAVVSYSSIFIESPGQQAVLTSFWL